LRESGCAGRLAAATRRVRASPGLAQRKHQILCAPIDRLHGAAAQHPREFFWRRPSDRALPVDRHFFNGSSDHRLAEAADEGFNFRQFRHVVILDFGMLSLD
jgi:hypothetical protein